ncbi:MAG TPA: heparan-alpha-glucosaminide N-acetyltransferase domain-containing protein [Gemmatimonadales bacterium]|nr:heparan-alpha-glucosaminide N-acetyltransferase domain-containing protein [Gemmatimonadales bacterium]
MRERLSALDAVRGMTIAGMLLVNNPGTWSAIYPPLEHAPWHGWTPTDLIFPFFVFIVGVTTHLSLSAREQAGASTAAIRAQILRRGALIILLGLLLHAFPFFPLTRITEIRIPGVLQRIGVCYLAAALFAHRRSNDAVVGLVGILLLSYWGLQTLVAPPGVASATIDVPGDTLSAWIDRSIFGSHLWRESRTWDPEGLLSTLPAIGTCLLGVLAGRALVRRTPLAERLNALFAWGAAGMVAGLVWNWVFPINKNLWTSSYVLFTAGMASVTIATCAWIIEVRGHRRWAMPFITYGLNPLVAFVGSGMLARMLGLIHLPFKGESVSLQQASYRAAFESWLSPRNASLAYAIAFVALWYGILLVLERRGWIFKV